ncbi:hypothetical protein M1D72_07840 [Vibrio sp. AK197]
MKALRNPVAILFTTLLAACSHSPSSQKSTPVATLDDPASIQVPTFVMRGQIVLGREAQSFMPCESQHQFWLDASDDKLAQLKPLLSAPYEPLYAELVGHLAPPSRTGLDADFTSRFVVDHFNFISADNPELCRQPNKPTRALGTEPFWSVEFDQQELIQRQVDAAPQPLVVTSRRIRRDQRFYQLENGFLQLDKRSCSDGMSDDLYGWQAEFHHDGHEYQGCGAISNLDVTQKWSATYQAQANDASNFTVTMTLNDDHSATTVYGYQNGDADSVENGYWQQLNDNQVQVVMTRHQRQYLVSKRIFTVDGKTLKAEKEQVGDVIYTIANGGLTLYKAQQ